MMYIMGLLFVFLVGVSTEQSSQFMHIEKLVCVVVKEVKHQPRLIPIRQ